MSQNTEARSAQPLANSGTGEIYATDGNGGIEQVSAYQGWRTDWSHIVSGAFVASKYSSVFFYESDIGHAELYVSDDQADLQLVQVYDGLRTGWTLIVPWEFGLLFYQASTGHGELYTFNGNGGLKLLKAYDGWRTDWTHIVDIGVLMFYEASTGHAEMYAYDGFGDLSLVRAIDGMRTDWTHIVRGRFQPSQLGQAAYTDLLFYAADAGHGEFYAGDGGGGLVPMSAYDGWRTDWTHIAAGTFSGINTPSSLLFYEASSGTGQFYATDGFGGMSLLGTNEGWRTDWASIVPGDFGDYAFTGLLFYEP